MPGFKMKHVARTNRSKRQNSGFTLLELMVIIVMVGILGAVAAPSWLSFLSQQRIRTVESDLIQTIKQTQQDAIQRRRSVVFEVKEDEDLPTVNNGIDITLGSGSNIRPGMVTLNAFSVNDDDSKNDDDVSLAFDHQGRPIELDADGDPIPQVLPFVITVSGENSNTQQCAIIANLIGSIKTAEGADCDNPPVDPVDPT
jgi:type II secretory pathway pseudopilin PulG